MDDIIAKARELGKLIGANERTKAFMAAAKAVSDDKAAQDVMREYQKQAESMQRLQMEGKPIEPDMKRRLADSQLAVASNASLKELSRLQADYLELMNKVNDAIEGSIGTMASA